MVAPSSVRLILRAELPRKRNANIIRTHSQYESHAWVYDCNKGGAEVEFAWSGCMIAISGRTNGSVHRAGVSTEGTEVEGV